MLFADTIQSDPAIVRRKLMQMRFLVKTLIFSTQANKEQKYFTNVIMTGKPMIIDFSYLHLQVICLSRKDRSMKSSVENSDSIELSRSPRLGQEFRGGISLLDIIKVTTTLIDRLDKIRLDRQRLSTFIVH